MRSPAMPGDTAGAMPSFLRRRCRLSQRDLSPGSYLTDGRNLFRVISQFVNGRSILVWLEHCITLEARPRAGSELEAMGMRAVGNARAQTVQPGSSSPVLAGDPAALR
jgi:hypothetical protein